eukprot:TRINITY_DN22029_c0_g2_i1.p1 TRINITY_DN22029_c0_g2~~TRINITY_DN22029_c0_g2_i1.p1  ORF type:complete len:493 (+),score=158.16 TRINITY_DN22029_c0_g2_i1:33-1511(+)
MGCTESRAQPARSRPSATCGPVVNVSSPVSYTDYIYNESPDREGAAPGRNAMHFAALTGDVALMRLLRSNGEDPESRDAEDWTPFLCAAAAGRTEAMRLLREWDADISSVTKVHRTALHYAAEEGHLHVAELLKEWDADLNAVSLLGRNAMHCAATKGQVEVMKLLHEWGVDPHTSGKDKWTALHGAASNGHTEAMQLLYGWGVDPEVSDIFGMTPLHAAVRNEQTEAMKHLLVWKGDERAVAQQVTQEALTPLNETPAALPEVRSPAGNACSKKRCLAALRAGMQSIGWTPSQIAYYLEHSECFCKVCWSEGSQKQRGARSGPKGSCRISLRKFCTPEKLQTAKAKWDVAYHGTTLDGLSGVLRSGHLLKAGDRTIDGRQLGIRQGHITSAPFVRKNLHTGKEEKFDPRRIFVSPSYSYAASSAYAKSIECDRRWYKIIFEVLVQPGSYEVGQQTVCATKQLDPSIPNESIEWYTESTHAHVLMAVLIEEC